MSCKCGGGCGAGPIILRPEIVMPDQSPGDITVDVTDHELLVLCAADGAAFLRRFTVDDGTVTSTDTTFDGTTPFAPVEPVGACESVVDLESPGEDCVHCNTLRLFDDGQAFMRTLCRDCSGAIVSVTDADLDGDDYVVTGTVTTCCPDEDESPGELVSQQAIVLCDDDGATSTTFVRTYELAGGQIAGFADADLDGATYTVTGTVGVCAPEEESPAEECGSTTVLQLCDRVPAADPEQPDTITRFLRHLSYDCDGAVTTVTDTLLDGQTQYAVAGEVQSCDPIVPCGNCEEPGEPEGDAAATDGELCAPAGSGIVPHPGGGGALWGGGTLNIPADPDGSAGNGVRTNRAVTAALQADAPSCDDGTVEVTVSVQVCNDGPNPAPADYSGSMCLFVGDCVELIPHAFLDAPFGPGECQTLTSTVSITPAQLAAGDLRAVIDVNTFSQQGGKSWTLSDFEATYAFGQNGCPDTPCPPSMSVNVCEPITVKAPDPTTQQCNSIFIRGRCDDVQGDGSEIVRYSELWCAGPTGQLRMLHTFRGDPNNYYAPTNPTYDCAETADVQTCGLPPDAVTSGEANSGVDGELQVVDNTGTLDILGCSHPPLPGGAQPLWDGGPFVFPADPASANTCSPGASDQTYRLATAQLVAERPVCDDGTVEVTVSVDVTMDGPSIGIPPYYGRLVLRNTRTGTYADADQIRQSTPIQPGFATTLTVAAKVPAVDLANGDLSVGLALETYQTSGVPGGGPKQWTATNFQASYAYGVDGCAEEVPSMAVRLCEPITVKYEPPPAGDDGDLATCGSDGVGITGSTSDGTFTATDTPADGRIRPNSTVNRRADLVGGGQTLWDGGTLIYPAETDGSAGDGLQVYRQATAILSAERPSCDDGTVQVTASVQVTNDGPNRGAGYVGSLVLFNQLTGIAQHDVQAQAPVGHQETLTVTAAVPAADLAAGRIAVQLELETWDMNVTDGPGSEPKTWTTDQFVASFQFGEEGCGEEGPVQRVTICGPVTIGGGMLSTGGATGGATSGVATGPQIVERCRCDDTTGDGVGDTEYVELWRVDPTGDETPAPIGTFLADDLAQPYEPVSPVPCPAEGGATVPVQITTGIRRLTGPASEDVAAFGMLQSATVTVLAGSATVTTGNGTAAVPAGVGLSWSVTRDQDQQLDVLTVVTGAGDDALVHVTYVA